MAGVFTSSTQAGSIFGQTPGSAGVLPTGQRMAVAGGGPPESFLILLEDGTGYIQLEDGSGNIELEAGP